MENSRAYNLFIEQLHATGTKKMDGYYPRLMEEIYDWERPEIEDIIWKTFCENGDSDLAVFLPILKRYQGKNKLDEMIENSDIPSERSMLFATILYETYLEDSYLDIIKKNIELEPENLSFVSKLVNCRPDSNIYRLLVELYINSSNDIVRSTAVTGILYNKGIISDPLDLTEMINSLDIAKEFEEDDISKRREIISKFEEKTGADL